MLKINTAARQSFNAVEKNTFIRPCNINSQKKLNRDLMG